MENYLFVDGTNLYASQFELFGPQRYLNFSKFIKEVEKKIKVKFNKIYGIFVLAIENRIPNRFTYIYKTIVFSFYKRVRVLPKQRIKVVILSRKRLLETV